MPGGDRTGPLGMGPLSGRGAGFCRGNSAPGYVAPRGRGAGRPATFGGYGRGWHHRFSNFGYPGRRDFEVAQAGPSAMTVEQRNREYHSLQQRAAFLRDELEALNRQLDELKSQTER